MKSVWLLAAGLSLTAADAVADHRSDPYRLAAEAQAVASELLQTVRVHARSGPEWGHITETAAEARGAAIDLARRLNCGDFAGAVEAADCLEEAAEHAQEDVELLRPRPAPWGGPCPHTIARAEDLACRLEEVADDLDETLRRGGCEPPCTTVPQAPYPPLGDTRWNGGTWGGAAWPEQYGPPVSTPSPYAVPNGSSAPYYGTESPVESWPSQGRPSFDEPRYVPSVPSTAVPSGWQEPRPGFDGSSSYRYGTPGMLPPRQVPGGWGNGPALLPPSASRSTMKAR